MNSRFLSAGAVAAILLSLSIDAAVAHDFKIGTIEIDHPWSRATPPGAKVGGGYMTLTNDGDVADKLVSATFAASDRAELHKMSLENGVMKMGAVKGGVDLPARGTVKLEPNGLHLMFPDLKKPLVRGTKVRGTLTFEKAGTVEVEFAVDSIGATGKGAKDDASDDMPGMKP